MNFCPGDAESCLADSVNCTDLTELTEEDDDTDGAMTMSLVFVSIISAISLL